MVPRSRWSRKVLDKQTDQSLTFADFGDEKTNGDAENEEKDRMKDHFHIIDSPFFHAIWISSTTTAKRTDDPKFHNTKLKVTVKQTNKHLRVFSNTKHSLNNLYQKMIAKGNQIFLRILTGTHLAERFSPRTYCQTMTKFKPVGL